MTDKSPTADEVAALFEKAEAAAAGITTKVRIRFEGDIELDVPGTPEDDDWDDKLAVAWGESDHDEVWEEASATETIILNDEGNEACDVWFHRCHSLDVCGVCGACSRDDCGHEQPPTPEEVEEFRAAFSALFTRPVTSNA